MAKAVIRHGFMCSCALAAALALATPARAGTFDALGGFVPDAGAAAYLDFSRAPGRYLPSDVSKKCAPQGYELAQADDALDGESLLRLHVVPGCEERLVVDVPRSAASYSASVWMRHGALNARLTVEYPASTGRGHLSARLFPTGRTTSDGWVELACNALPVDEVAGRLVVLKVSDFASLAGVDLDALEVVATGPYEPEVSCTGVHDPACGTESVCEYGKCKLGRVAVPPLPPLEIRGDMVDMFASRLAFFFGGKRTRTENLPRALAIVEETRGAKTAWELWNGWSRAVRALHDTHTNASGAFGSSNVTRRLNACFFEGDADLTQTAWPKDPRFADVLVSHAGTDAAGLHAGDRVVAIDGLHPFEWAKPLENVNWNQFVASDPDVYAEVAEQLGGSSGTIARYATTLTVLRCDAEAGTCADVPETIQVASLTSSGQGPDVSCDNRPFYHLAIDKPPDPATHRIYGSFFRGPIEGTTPDEHIEGMVWDTLYGGGDPESYVNAHILDAIADWKAHARGVILDHRAGNGGTLDAASYVTTLVRPKSTVAVVRMPIEIAGFDGPADAAEGVAIFQKNKSTRAYVAGASDHDPALPVALLIHRDVSASDFMPFAMKGAPHVRIFGPHQTAGGFSTFINLEYYGDIGYQLASGDTIAADGSSLIGHGVEPDEIVLPKQSDLLAGKDTIHEAALAWVRQELKP